MVRGINIQTQPIYNMPNTEFPIMWRKVLLEFAAQHRAGHQEPRMSWAQHCKFWPDFGILLTRREQQFMSATEQEDPPTSSKSRQTPKTTLCRETYQTIYESFVAQPLTIRFTLTSRNKFALKFEIPPVRTRQRRKVWVNEGRTFSSRCREGSIEVPSHR